MNNPSSFKKNVLYYRLAVLLPFLILAFLLFRFQIIEGEKYYRIAEHNFVRVQRIIPVRGEIFDRNFNPIAANQASSNLYVLPVKIKNLADVAGFVSSHFPISEDEIRKMVYGQRFRSYQELLLVQNVNYDKVVEISEQLERYPSLFFRNENMRHYSFNNHFTGYVNRISPAEMEQFRDQGYTINSLIGKTGLERQYEHLLKGKPGFRLMQVDATGRSYRFFKHNETTPAVAGADILLTIDGRLQSYLESIFPEDFNGAIVVLDPRTGGVLAYVSRPNYNLNMFSGTIGRDYWQSLVTNPDSPLLDRVTMANYSPASVFKTYMAAVALDNGIAKADTKLSPCRGSFRFGNRTFNCWLERGHGQVTLVEAIKHSCNVYFYDLSLQISLSKIHDFITANQLTSRTGIDLPVERAGLFPDEQWYTGRKIARASITGHKINLAIGQGEVLFTPLQVASFYAAIANNGLWKQPYLFSRVISSFDDENGDNFFPPPRETRELNITPETIAILQTALHKAVNEAGGTGGASRSRGVNVYGKTGTGQNPGTNSPNAWFAGYAVWQEPELAWAIIVERVPDGGGGRDAAPLAGKMISFYNDHIRRTSFTELEQ